jgi:MscS family membrane protein
MSVKGKTSPTARCMIIFLSLILALLVICTGLMAQVAAPGVSKDSSPEAEPAEKPPVKKPPVLGPADDYDRGVPRSSVKGFFKATRDGDYKKAAQYLDLRYLPSGIREAGPELARQFKIVLDRTMWVDLDTLSDSPKGMLDDGLPPFRDIMGRIKTPQKSVDILLQQVPRNDGVLIWKFSNRTVAEIPHLSDHFGYGPFEEWLSKQLPDYTLFGWQTWQWVLFLVFIGLAYVGALLPTWVAGLILRRKDTEIRLQAARLITGPVRILLWLLLLDAGIHFIGPSASIRSAMKGGALIIIAFTWTAIGIVNLLFKSWSDRMQKNGQESAIVLMQPVKKIINIFIIALAVLLWLDNIGFNISTLIAGLGVGGVAIALAAQDTLKNFIGSVMILLDKPYKIGQRIVVRGHDGIVEEIGLRSTRMRLLTGHQTTIPNEEMARVDIENIGRRPHIRRLTNISITYDTPPDKIEKAVEIILKILDNHEGMDPAFPPRAYFNEFNPYSLNLLILYWYHPADYWGYMAHSQQVNIKIMREFDKEGIKFAFPTSTTYLTQDGVHPLQVRMTEDAQLKPDAVA